MRNPRGLLEAGAKNPVLGIDLHQGSQNLQEELLQDGDPSVEGRPPWVGLWRISPHISLKGKPRTEDDHGVAKSGQPLDASEPAP